METAQHPLNMGPLDISVPVVVIAPGYHGHAIARSLGRHGIRVYGVHADPRSPAARSRYWKKNAFWNLAKHPPDVSVDMLLWLGAEIGGRPILLPTDDESCLFVADHAEQLRAGFRFPNQPAGLARLLSSKETMYELCKRHAIPTPQTFFPRSRDDVFEYLKTARFPVVLKGIDTVAFLHSSGKRMAIADDARCLLQLYDEWEKLQPCNLVLQEYIPGSSGSSWMFNGYFDDNSACLFGITGKKIREYPASGGVTSLGVCVANETVSALTVPFMKALGYRGILDIDYKYDERDGQYKLLDVNPRTGTAFRLFVDQNGTDVVRALYRDLTGQVVERAKPREGRKWLAENFDFISSASNFRHGKLGVLEWIRSFRGLEEASWFAADDLRSFLAMAARSFRWLFQRYKSQPTITVSTNETGFPLQARDRIRAEVGAVEKTDVSHAGGQRKIRG
ncbi:MAG TPA: carboxylate--amine ligase [Terriglobia bacterium]|nr:carboxylate--amine ligase [Terriglobia bacterium]